MSSNQTAQSVTVITRVTPIGNVVSGVALEYDSPQDAPSSFVVNATLTRTDTGDVASGSRTVVKAYSNSTADFASAPAPGRFIILELDETDTLAGASYNDGERTQFYDLIGAYSITVPGQPAVVNTHVRNLVVDDYAADEFVSSTGKVVPFRTFTPATSGPQKYPLVVTLHGYGESGVNNFSQIAGNQISIAFANPERQRDTPAFVLAPQANPDHPASGAWWDAPMQPAVIELVEQTIAQHPEIDRDRVYLTGLSMGSYGSWGIVLQRSDLFAGALLVCGSGGAGNETAIAAAVSELPIWAVHSIDDVVVSYPENGSDFLIFEALEAAGTQVTWTEWDADISRPEHVAAATRAAATAASTNSIHIFTTFTAGTTPWGAHGSWIPVYDNDAMLDWLFAQRKG